MYESNGSALAKSRERQVKASDELSSGIRVAHPWEDPAAAGLSVEYDGNVRTYQNIGTSLQRASDELNTADGGLGDVGELLSRARELATQMSNDTYNPAERANAAKEVDGLFQSAITTLNRQVGGRYIFGGFLDGAPPFDATGNYVGDTGVRQVEVGPNVWYDASVRADVAIKGVGGGVDALATLTTLSAALTANDATAIRGTLDSLASAISQVAQARSLAGTQQNVFDTAYTAVRGAQDDQSVALAREVEANPFDAASRLALSERALEATIEATARIGKLSLLGKL